MCELCERVGVLQKDVHLLEHSHRRLLNLPTGVRVEMVVSRFRADEKPKELRSNQVVREDKYW